MRLINTATLEQEQFFDSRVPRYAILSHTWGEQEVTCQQLREDLQPWCINRELIRDYFRDSAKLEPPAGWKKIIDCCRLAHGQGFQWVWIDTCCIDKTSSAELSEAINSMYEWYQKADVCYAFLDDFQKLDGRAALSECHWFSRGWTLQELLAPSKVEFYDRNMAFFGDRMALADWIATITGIPAEYLRQERQIHEACIAQRMFWASRRKTTRLEDSAYCLLGIFDVNMPLLYGERGKAFMRLQQQILTSSGDETIFAWTSPDSAPCGMLARSLEAFSGANNICRIDARPRRPPSTSTNQVLEFAVTMRWLHWILPSTPNHLHVPIACTLDSEHAGKRLSLDLVRPSAEHWLWTRIPSPHHRPYNRLGLLYDLEIIFAGYTKVNVVLDQRPLPRSASKVRPNLLLVGSHMTSLFILFIATCSSQWASWIIDDDGRGENDQTSAEAAKADLNLSTLFVFAWYIRLAKGSLWSMVVPVVFLFVESPRRAMATAAMLCLLSVFHFFKEYGRR